MVPEISDEALLVGTESPEFYRRYHFLFRLYGPLLDTPWIPYQCPTIFAAIDKLPLRPLALEPSPLITEPPPVDAFAFMQPWMLFLVDLPGAATIEMATLLTKYGRGQLVSTFDHWPDAPGLRSGTPVINSRDIPNAMFTMAREVQKARRHLLPHSPPVWVCDRRRLGNPFSSPATGMFDNRYYIDDSILPGMKVLKQANIRAVVYVAPHSNSKVSPDLVPFLIEAAKEGLELRQVLAAERESWVQPVPMKVPSKVPLPIYSYKRTDLGGFGKLIPEPSEGGSYSSGGGGG